LADNRSVCMTHGNSVAQSPFIYDEINQNR
jgi:hypothetical protein